MPEYKNGDTPIVRPGVYQLVYNSVSSGTGKIEISKNDGVTYQDMVDGSFTASEDRVAFLGGARYRITLTGDAKMYLDLVHK